MTKTKPDITNAQFPTGVTVEIMFGAREDNSTLGQ